MNSTITVALYRVTIHNGKKPPVDLDFGCSLILPWQSVATVAAQQLPELSELNPQEVFSVVNCHPVWYPLLSHRRWTMRLSSSAAATECLLSLRHWHHHHHLGSRASTAAISCGRPSDAADDTAFTAFTAFSAFFGNGEKIYCQVRCQH